MAPHKGNIPWNKDKKGVMPTPWNKGVTHTDEVKAKIKEKRAKQVFSFETRKKMSEARKGSKCIFWKGGTTSEGMKIRSSFEYRLWRESVFKRDNWTCVWCGKVGGKLNADHIKPFCDYPELRFAIDNGRTLCIECHKKTDTYLCKARWNKNICL